MKMKIIFPLLFMSSMALANDAALLKCRAISDAAARLACYDALPLTPSEAKTVQGVPQQTGIPKQTPQQFGLEQQANKAALESIESHIPGRFEGWGPRSTIQLANGQTWQISDDSRRIHDIHNPKVTIRRGALGAFYLEIEGTNVSPRVKRLQ